MKVIKKLLLFIMVLLVSLSSSPVNASSSVTWYDDTTSITQTTSAGELTWNYYTINVDVEIPNDTNGISIDLPYDEGFMLNYITDEFEELYPDTDFSTYEQSNFKFYSQSLGVYSLQTTVTIDDLKGDFGDEFDNYIISGEYKFEFSKIITQYDLTEDISKISVSILTNYVESVTLDDVPINETFYQEDEIYIDDIIDEYNNDGRVTFTYYDYSFNLGESDFDIEWVSNNVSLDNYTIDLTIDLLVPIETLSLYIPPTFYHTEETDFGYYPVVTVYDGEFSLGELNLTLYGLKTYDGLIIIDMNDPVSDLDGIDYNDIDSVTITIPQNYNETPSNYLDYLDENTIAIADADINMVYYITNGEIIYQSPFLKIPLKYDGYSAGYKFNNWLLADGSIYDYTIVSDDMLVDGILYLYGSYSQFSDIDYDPDELVADESTGISLLLAELNFDNSVGYTIIYLFLVLIAVFGLLKFNVNSMFIAITLLLITGLFMYLQWLPIIVSLVAIFAIIFIIYLSVGGE